MLLRQQAPSLLDGLLGMACWRASAALLPPQPLASTSESTQPGLSSSHRSVMQHACPHAPQIPIQSPHQHQQAQQHPWQHPWHILVPHCASFSSTTRPMVKVVPKLPTLTPRSRRLGMDPADSSSSSGSSSSRVGSALANTKTHPNPRHISGHPPVEPYGPLVVRYPQTINYYADREIIIQDTEGNPLGISTLDGNVFNVPVRLDILQRVVRYLRAAWQQGTHSSKNRAEVRGGGRKPRPQKGGGVSRQGSIRSPLWVKGGVAHGPRPRSHAHKLPRAVRMMGLRCALSAKGNEGRLVIVDTLLPQGLTTAAGNDNRLLMKEAVATLTARLPGTTALLVDTSEERGAPDGGLPLRKATAGVKNVEVMAEGELTVYHLLKFHILIITEPAARALCERLSAPHRVSKPLRYEWWLRQQAAVRAAAEELKAGEDDA